MQLYPFISLVSALPKKPSIKLRKPIAIVFFLLTQAINASASRYAEVDSFVIKVSFPASTITQYDSLIDIFSQHFTEQEERVRAVYFWVTENISYDGQGLFDGNMIGDRIGALKYKRCVCAGYADLLDYAFRRMGLETKYLTGKVRMLDGRAQWNPDAWRMGHAWNAVKVNNDWKLIDATWASGYLQGRRFEKKRDDVWFFMPPAILILSHFPDKVDFQLLDKPITEGEFYQQAYFLWEFSSSGIYAISHPGLVISGEPGETEEIWVQSDKPISHIIISNQEDEVIKMLPVIKRDGKYYFKYLVGSIKKGSYFIGFMYIDENRKCIWRTNHVLGYFFSFSDAGATNLHD